jgi:hypothetical protein
MANVDAEMEQLDEAHRVEVMVYLSKIKSCEYEHNLSLEDISKKSKYNIDQEEL